MTDGSRTAFVTGRDGTMALLVAWVVALVAVAVFKLLPGMDPDSLFLDDQWVGIAVRDVGFLERLALHPPMPLGFALLEGLPGRFIQDPEVALQILPVLAYLASMALFAVLVHRLTGDPWVTTLGAAMIVSAPLTTDLAVRAKQYTLDQLVTVGVLLAMVELFRAITPRRLFWSALALLVGVVLSFVSVFLSSAVVLTACVSAWSSEQARTTEKRGVALVGGAFFLALGAFYFLELRHGTRVIMLEFWAAYFPPLTDLAGVWPFLSQHLFAFLHRALPARFAPMLLLLPVGLVWLWRSGHRRSLTAIALFYGSVLAASMLRTYPVGTGRTDVFSFAVTTLLVCLGVAFLVRRVTHRLVRQALYVGILAAFAVSKLAVRGAIYYPQTPDRPAVAWVQDRLAPEDGLVLSPYGVFAFGYYTDSPMSVTAADYYGHGFDLTPERPRTHKTFIGRLGTQDPEILPREVDRLVAFLAQGHRRVIYLETNAFAAGPGTVPRLIESEGYRLTERTRFGTSADAYLFEIVEPE
jgi:hypothetical protein